MKRIHHKSTALLLALGLLALNLLALGLCPPRTARAYTGSGGAGTAADPYLISSVADLEQLRDEVNTGTSHAGHYFRLTADLSLGSIPNWMPIGMFVNSFSGRFDGDGHSISDLTITINSFAAGLFGYIENATIEKLAVTNVSINVDTFNAAAVVGQMGDASTIRNCYASGTIVNTTSTKSMAVAGGIVGKISGAGGRVAYCYAQCSAQATNTVIAGLNTGIAGAASIAGYIDSGASPTVEHCVALNSVVQASGANAANSAAGRVVALHPSATPLLAHNYGLSTLVPVLNGMPVTIVDSTAGIDGGATTPAVALNQDFWQNTVGFDPSIWRIQDGQYPVFAVASPNPSAPVQAQPSQQLTKETAPLPVAGGSTGDVKAAESQTGYLAPMLVSYVLEIPEITDVRATSWGNGRVRLSVNTLNSRHMRYQWQVQNEDGTWRDIGGANSSVYNVRGLRAGKEYAFRCVVTSFGGGQTISDPVKVTVTADR